jgi:hypothetical protein
VVVEHFEVAVVLALVERRHVLQLYTLVLPMKLPLRGIQLEHVVLHV